MGVTVSPNDVGQNAIKAGIPGTYTKPKGKDAPDWFTKALDAGNGTFESTSDAAKMLGGSNSWVVSKTEVKITYKQSKKAENPDKYKDKTLDKKSTPWATLTEGRDWFVNGECAIFWCGVQQKWHMTGPDGLYYRRGTDETSTEEVPKDKWYCCTGYNGGGNARKSKFAVGGVPEAKLEDFREKTVVCKNMQKLLEPHKTKEACDAADNCEWVRYDESTAQGLLPGTCDRCKFYSAELVRTADPDSPYCKTPECEGKKLNKMTECHANPWCPVAIPCKKCKGTGEVLSEKEKEYTRLKY